MSSNNSLTKKKISIKDFSSNVKIKLQIPLHLWYTSVWSTCQPFVTEWFFDQFKMKTWKVFYSTISRKWIKMTFSYISLGYAPYVRVELNVDPPRVMLLMKKIKMTVLTGTALRLNEKHFLSLSSYPFWTVQPNLFLTITWVWIYSGLYERKQKQKILFSRNIFILNYF